MSALDQEILADANDHASKDDDANTEEQHSEDEDVSDEDREEDFVFKKLLRNCLGKVTSAGSFSTFHHFPVFPNPGLHIKGFGPVYLPLREDDAQAITKLSTLGPLGMKEQTVVDTAVRNTWELNTSEFEFRNPAWKPFFDDLACQAMMELGVETAVRPESYKLLLYEEGAFFEAHKDSEKVPGMFGTLVLCLPSEHVGGEVHLSHADQKKVLDTATTSKFDLTSFSWYSDVKHEIRPVRSGHRLVLIYNLVDTSRATTKQTAAQLYEKRNELECLLRRWKRDLDNRDKIVYILDHQYTKPSLCLQSLKGQDRPLGQFLDTVCSQNDFQLLFAQMTKDNDDLSLEHLVLPHGLLVAESCGIEEDDILREDPFDRDADSEKEGEWTGNEGTTGYMRYHNTACGPTVAIYGQVAVMVPSKSLPNLLAASPSCSDIAGCNRIEFFCKKSDENLHDLTLRSRALEMLRFAATSTVSRSSSTGGDYVLSAMKWALKWKHEAFFRRVAQSSSAAEKVLESLGQSMGARKGGDCPDWDARHCRNRIGVVAAGIKPVSALSTALTKFHDKIVDASHRASFSIWMTKYLDKGLELAILSQYRFGSEEDIPHISSLIENRPADWTKTTLLPRLSATYSNEFVTSLLHSLFEQRTRPAYAAVVCDAFRHFMRTNSSAFVLDVNTYPGHSYDRYSWHNNRGANSPRITKRRRENYFKCMEECVALGLMTEAKRFLIKSIKRLNVGSQSEVGMASVLESLKKLMVFWDEHMDVDLLPVSTIKMILTDSIERFKDPEADLTYFLGTLEGLMKFSQKHGFVGILPAATIKATFVRMLHPTISDLIKRKPQEPQDWKRSAIKCQGSTRNDYNPNGMPIACADCAELNRFLVNPVEQVARFSWIDPRRNHISRYLNPRYYVWRTDKGRTPHTLIITKTKKQYEEQFLSWKADVADLHRQLTPFRNSWGKRLLGDKYVGLVSLSTLLGSPETRTTSSATTGPVQAPRDTPSSHGPRPISSANVAAFDAKTPQSLNRSGPNSAAAVKRKAENQLSGPDAAKKKAQVIELSDED